MPFSETFQPLIVILGPTAVGKTEISIQLAENLGAEIVSADSRLFYRGMDIGTAKPTKHEQARVPHHLIDIANPDQVWSLAMFQQEARQVITDILNRNRIPFLVGGTGQYIRAVTEEWEIPKVEPDQRLRHALENWTKEINPYGLHQRLSILDREAAVRIDPRNMRRTIRALEVIFLTGKEFSKLRSRGVSRYRILQLGLTRSRSELYDRIDDRIENMIKLGLVVEVQELLRAGYAPELPPLSAIGYRQMIEYLQGNSDLDQAVNSIKQNTRKFVRRQANWFKLEDPAIQWYQVRQNVVNEMEDAIRAFLSQNNLDFVK